MLTHGWPGSIIEFLDAIPLRRERFHVVVVSMPGCGFSGPTQVRGVDVAKVAAAVADVMAQLGYERYVAQGGDWGALIDSIGSLVAELPPETAVHPGHGPSTTLGAELATNPFLAELRDAREVTR